MSVSTIDRAGVAISTLCILHCMILPLAVSSLPILGAFTENEGIHKILVLCAILPAVIAFLGLSKSKAALWCRGLLVIGAACLIAGAYIEALHDFEKVLTIIGAMSLASAHLWKIKLNRPHTHEV